MDAYLIKLLPFSSLSHHQRLPYPITTGLITRFARYLHWLTGENPAIEFQEPYRRLLFVRVSTVTELVFLLSPLSNADLYILQIPESNLEKLH